MFSFQEVFTFGPAPSGCTTFTDLLSEEGSTELPAVDLDSRKDIICLPYSSGTTGMPKGVAITSYNFIACMMQMR